MKIALYTLLSLLLFSCSDSTSTSQLPMQEIKGRDYDGSRLNIYRVRAPSHWIRRDPLPDESLSDTKKPIVEFLIPQDNESIRITIHNFPSDTIEQRIPPRAQVERWQRQFEFMLPEETATFPQAFSGYAGLMFKGTGKLKQENKTIDDAVVLGWSLQLGNEEYNKLLYPPDESENNRFREMRADVTIKAVGPKNVMEAHEEEIISFARSFELIEEIPSRP